MTPLSNHNPEHIPPSRFDLSPAGQHAPTEKLSSGVWQIDANQAATSLEKQVERTLHRRFLVGGILIIIVCSILMAVGINVIKNLTYVDELQPDYSSLDADSENYWEERTKINIQTAHKTKNAVLQHQRLQRFIDKSIRDAMFIDSDYNRITAVSMIALTLAKNDVDFTIDKPMEQLGTSHLASSMRCRVFVSQALMYLRLGKFPSAKVAITESNRLFVATDQRLNSAINEETFFGTVTVLAQLQESQELPVFFKQQLEFVLVLSLDQQSRVFRLIAGEQVRAGMINDAISTFKKIRNPLEIARALELLIAYSGRPPQVKIAEPAMLVLQNEPADKPLVYPDRTKNIVREIFQWIAQTTDADVQIDLLQRVADSRLMYDKEIHALLRESIAHSPDFADVVKKTVLPLLDNPQSQSIRSALHLPERKDVPKMNIDSADEDWTTQDETIPVPVADIDIAPLINRLDEQTVQTLILTAQSYMMCSRFHDAVRVLRKAAAAAQKMQKPDVRITLLLRTGEQQIASGAFAEARRTLHSISLIPEAAPQQLAELARLQVIGRFFSDALETLQAVSVQELRDGVYRFLAMEQLRTQRLDGAAATLGKMSQGKAADEVRHFLNIAKGQGNDADYAAVSIPNPAKQDANNENDNADGEQSLSRCCERLIQSGLLHQAGKEIERIGDKSVQSRLRSRIVREYLLLYNAYREEQDIRQYLFNEVFAAAEQAAQDDRTVLWTVLLDTLTSQFQTETEREAGRKLWERALTACRSIQKNGERAECLAQLLLAKIAMEKPLGKGTYPLITKESNPLVYEETAMLIDECRRCVESTETAAKQGKPCVLLSKVLAQVGRTKAANSLIEQAREIAGESSNSAETADLYLMMIPVYKSLNESAVIPELFETAIKTITNAFTEKIQQVDILDWRLRDSSIDAVIRNMMEYGFMDTAVRSLNRINEPVLRDRLIRAAAYIYLDQNNIDVAEPLARRITMKEMQQATLKNVLLAKRRSEQREVVLPPQ
ncbi:MAG: hypothetical protein LBT46_06460 [Planctomycetaceae bacterium]|jgi:hypothetical protein|nr:hypothetical protein [Planctomycetaceae bacterium]